MKTSQNQLCGFPRVRSKFKSRSKFRSKSKSRTLCGPCVDLVWSLCGPCAALVGTSRRRAEPQGARAPGPQGAQARAPPRSPHKDHRRTTEGPHKVRVRLFSETIFKTAPFQFKHYFQNCSNGFQNWPITFKTTKWLSKP